MVSCDLGGVGGANVRFRGDIAWPVGKGHDSLEDAVAALDLLKAKAKEAQREEERRLHQERQKRGSQQLPHNT